MIQKEDITAIIKGITPALKEFVISAIDERLKALPVAKDGEAGKQGEQGPAGRDGKDAPPVDVEAIMIQIEDRLAKAVAAIPVPKDGKDGLNGKDGAAGKDGAPGRDAEPINRDDLKGYIDREIVKAAALIPVPKDGKDGLNGKDGERGQDAPPVNVDAIIETLRVRVDAQLKEAVAEIPKPQDGRDGRDGRDGIAKDGRDGKDGKDGEAGRDAADIVILETIDESKTYPRGTFASHKGGLWISEQKGWRCVVRGESELDFHQDPTDPRIIIAEVTLSDGTVKTKEYRIPFMLDAGIYKDGGDYRMGDAVTFDGSQWVCQVEVTKAKPGTCTDWRLVVRKGRDGKDLREAKDAAIPTKPVRLR